MGGALHPVVVLLLVVFVGLASSQEPSDCTMLNVERDIPEPLSGELAAS